MTDEKMKKFNLVIIPLRWSQEFYSDAGYFSLLHLADNHVPPAAIHVLTGGLAEKKTPPKKLYLKIIKKTPDTFAWRALKLYTVIKFLKFLP